MLEIDEAVLGFLIDNHGNPYLGSALLKRESNGSITLQLVWDEKSSSPMSQWFIRDSQGDCDNAPTQLRFRDGSGNVHTLQRLEYGLRFLTSDEVDLDVSDPVLRYAQASVSVGLAIHDGKNDYSSIRMLSSQAEGFYAWFSGGLPDKGGEQKYARYQSASSETIGVADRISLIVGSGGQTRQDGRKRYQNFSVSLSTVSEDASSWGEHLKIHESVSALVEISALRYLGFADAFDACGIDDQLPRASVTFSIRHREDVLEEKDLDAVFDYANIGQWGVNEWVRISREYDKGMGSFLMAIRNQMTPNDLCVQTGLAFENIGFQIGIERNWGHTKADGGGLIGKIKRVVDDVSHLGNGWDSNRWSHSMADSYNTVKHNRELPQPDHIIARDALSALQVLRAWVGTRLGASGISIVESHDGSLHTVA